MICPRLGDRALLALLAGGPAAALALAYGYLAAFHGRLWLFDVVVHENGRDTLLAALLFWDHFLGMLPHLVIFTGVAVAAALRYAAPGARARVRGGPRLLAALGLAALAFGMSVRTVGLDETLLYLFQHRERVDLVTPGGNWKMMVTADLLYVPHLALFALLVRGLRGGRCAPRPGWWRPLAAAGALFVGASVALGADGQAFTDPRWLGHNLRELTLWGLIGFPILFAAFHRVESAPDEPPAEAGPILRAAAPWVLVLAPALAWHVYRTLSAGLGGLTQRPTFAPADGLPIPYLLASAAFEHGLDYVFVTLFGSGLYATLLGAREDHGAGA